MIDKKEAINRLRYEKPNMQICFWTEDALKSCISDMNCMSDGYLAEELEIEYKRVYNKKVRVQITGQKNRAHFHIPINIG